MARRVVLFLLVFLFCVFIVTAQFRSARPRHWTPSEQHLARLEFDADLARFEPLDGARFYVLTVSGGDGFVSRMEFMPNEAILFPLVDQKGNTLPDGSYSYQLRALANPRDWVPAGRESSRSDGSRQREARPDYSQTGIFEIVNGLPTVSPPASDAVPMDQVYPVDDHLLRGNTCVGTPCDDGEIFPKAGYYPVLKVKGIEPTVLLEDTTGGDTSWQIAADDEGSNEFAITEVTPSVEFDQLTIKSGARENALYVDSSGLLGLGTLPNQDQELHILGTGVETNICLEEPLSGRTFTLSNYSTAFSVDGNSMDILKLAWDAPRYTLTAGANGVGVGLDQPSAPLHVHRSDGTSKVFVEETVKTAEVRTLFQLENNGAPRFAFKNTSSGVEWSFQQSGPGNFLVSREGTGGPEMQVYQTGRVRMGPGGVANFDLDGVGNLTIKGGLTASGSTFPDYVFDPGYKLMSLTDLRTYIEQNRRLPDIPSAEEVKGKGGHNMTELQLKLLEKIEELTLYTLEQEKRLQVQGEKLREMEALERKTAQMKAELAEIRALLSDR